MTAILTDAGLLQRDDKVWLDGAVWTVTVVHHIGGTVSLTLASGDSTIQIARDAREKLTVFVADD